MKLSCVHIAAAGLALLSLGQSFASSPSPDLRVVHLVEGFTDPTRIALAPDGEIFIVERHGRIKAWREGMAEPRLVSELAVISDEKALEDGLLSMVLDPHYAQNHWVYLFHSVLKLPENQISRFTMKDGKLDLSSQKILMKIPDDQNANHSGGGLGFDRAGNLYISTGDNSFINEMDGFPPLDERPNRKHWDSQRTAANTRDPRGKILRIHPEPDGTYSIPDGNLLPRDGSKGLPEIYVMGVRNPFRFSLDSKTGWLFWGDVGPDALQTSPDRGAAGFDEYNVATRAGNFGWPYFIGDNRPYRKYNFETKQAGEVFDPAHPVNTSPNNTGIRDLPPAQPALIWYPPGPSARFPEMGSGARSAMAGPRYYFDAGLKSDRKLPARYDGSLFVFEWERSLIREVRLTRDAKLEKLNVCLEGEKFRRPIDIELGADGALYVLEYGTGWANNKDGRLTRIEGLAPESKKRE